MSGLGVALRNVAVVMLRLLLAGSLMMVNTPYHDLQPVLPLYDFIIVGAGSAGSVMGARLAEERGWRVLVLKAGGDVPLEAHVPAFNVPLEAHVPAFNVLLLQGDADWHYRTAPQKHSLKAFQNNTIPYPRGRCAGGSSSINSMIYIIAEATVGILITGRDGEPGLGLQGRTVLPYFKKSEHYTGWLTNETSQYHGEGGPQVVENERWWTPVAAGL